jgi:hypothetical protein
MSKWEQFGVKLQVISVADDFLASPLANQKHNLSTFMGAHKALILRQRVFIQSCTKIMRSWGVHWTSYIDLDEYLTFENGYGENLTSVAKSMQAWQLEAHVESPCYTLPRLRYGANETMKCSLSIVLDGEESLTTRRFVQHAQKGDFHASKFGKVLMNVTALADETVEALPRVIHRPYPSYCRPAGVVVNELTRLRANHYTGGIESYMSRGGDARRSEEAWQDFARHDSNHSCEDPIMSSWVERLVNIVGSATIARDLLQVDNLPALMKPLETQEDSVRKLAYPPCTDEKESISLLINLYV